MEETKERVEIRVVIKINESKRGFALILRNFVRGIWVTFAGRYRRTAGVVRETRRLPVTPEIIASFELALQKRKAVRMRVRAR